MFGGTYFGEVAFGGFQVTGGTPATPAGFLTLQASAAYAYPLTLNVRGPAGPYQRVLAASGPFLVSTYGEAELLTSSFPEVTYY